MKKIMAFVMILTIATMVFTSCAKQTAEVNIKEKQPEIATETQQDETLVAEQVDSELSSINNELDAW